MKHIKQYLKHLKISSLNSDSMMTAKIKFIAFHSACRLLMVLYETSKFNITCVPVEYIFCVVEQFHVTSMKNKAFVSSCFTGQKQITYMKAAL